MKEMKLSPEPFRRKIEDAAEEGNYLEAARLWAELCRDHPDNESFRIEEIAALILASAWPEAEERARAAVADFSQSIFVWLAQANIAYRSLDWGLAVERYEQIRRRFDPERSHESLGAVLVQLHCYEMMSEHESARALAAASWPKLRRSTFRFRHECILLGTLLDPRHRDAHLAWVSRSVPKSFRANFYKRATLASRNEAWIQRHAPGVTLLSLGQNCLPWMLPNRWGLRPGAVDMSPLSPFDYFAAVGDKAAEAIESDFEFFLQESSLRPFFTAAKIPALMNEAMQASFFHETGNWWSERDWARLKNAYRNRIAGFRKQVRNGQTLYFYAICGAASADRLIDVYRRFLHDENSRLLIVNLLKEPVAATIEAPGVKLVHIPYPEDYTWTHWEEFTSDRGVAFELQITRELLEQIRQLAGSAHIPPPPEQLSVLDRFRGALRAVSR